MTHCSEERVDPRFEIQGDLGRIEMTYEGEAEVIWGDGRREDLIGGKGERGVFKDTIRAIANDSDQPAASLAMARAQTLCACGTFESSAIHEIPVGLRRVEAASGRIEVTGMTELIQRAYVSSQLFSELDVDWAVPGQRISLEGYGCFPSFWPDIAGG